MTPELKNACELVFQEHKACVEPINWNKNSFNGRLSFGMAALARQTLENRNIIQTIKQSKKTLTVLNPIVLAAASFEEAEEWIQEKTPELVHNRGFDQVEYIMNHVLGYATTTVDDEVTVMKVRGTPIQLPAKKHWWTKPLFSYFIWPLFGAIGGVLITHLLGLLI